MRKPRTKLNQGNVDQIRQLYGSGQMLMKDIAIMFDVHISTVSNVVNFRGRFQRQIITVYEDDITPFRATQEHVDQIRDLYFVKHYTMALISTKFKTSQSLIWKIVNERGRYSKKIRPITDKFPDIKVKFDRSDDHVSLIRKMYSADGYSIKKISSSFGVSYATIWSVVNRKRAYK